MPSLPSPSFILIPLFIFFLLFTLMYFGSSCAADDGSDDISGAARTHTHTHAPAARDTGNGRLRPRGTVCWHHRHGARHARAARPPAPHRAQPLYLPSLSHSRTFHLAFSAAAGHAGAGAAAMAVRVLLVGLLLLLRAAPARKLLHLVRVAGSVTPLLLLSFFLSFFLLPAPSIRRERDDVRAVGGG